MSTSTRDKIIAYLAQDIQQSIVATSCGVTPAYVSQLLELEEVRLEIAKLRAQRLDGAIDLDTSIERIERAALKQVENRLPFVKTAAEAAKIFATLNGAKRKTVGADANQDVLSAQQVTITLPRAAAIHFRVNEVNQVIEVDGRTMAPLPSRALPALQKKLHDRDIVTDVQAVSSSATRPVAKVRTPVPTEADVAMQQKQASADTARAQGILRDLTTHMNGVAVVL